MIREVNGRTGASTCDIVELAVVQGPALLIQGPVLVI